MAECDECGIAILMEGTCCDCSNKDWRGMYKDAEKRANGWQSEACASNKQNDRLIEILKKIYWNKYYAITQEDMDWLEGEFHGR